MPVDVMQSQERQLLAVGEVALFLGISITSVWRLTKRGDLPTPIRFGGMTRWRRSDLESFIARDAA